VDFKKFFRLQLFRYIKSKFLFLIFVILFFLQFGGWFITYLDTDYNRQLVFKENKLVELRSKFENAKKRNLKEVDITYYEKEIKNLESEIKELELIKKYLGKKEFIQTKIQELKNNINLYKNNNDLKQTNQLAVELLYYERLLKEKIYKPKNFIAIENVWISNTMGFRWMDVFFGFIIIALCIATLFGDDLKKGYIKMLFPNYRIKREKLYIYNIICEVIIFLLIFTISVIVFSALIYVLFKRKFDIKMPYFTIYGLQTWGNSVIVSPEKTTFDSCLIGFLKLFVVYSLITVMLITLYKMLYTILANDYFVLGVVIFLKMVNSILPKLGIERKYLLINPLTYTDGWGIVTKSLSLDYNVLIGNSLIYIMIIVCYTLVFIIIGLIIFRKKNFY